MTSIAGVILRRECVLLLLGFLLGKFGIIESLGRTFEAMSPEHKIRIGWILLALAAFWLVVVVLPLNRIAAFEARSSKGFPEQEETSFRDQLRRRSSF